MDPSVLEPSWLWGSYKINYFFPFQPNVPAVEPRNTPGSSTGSGRNATGVQYRIEEREVKARMDTAVVRTILDMGFQRNQVMTAIRRNLTTHGTSEYCKPANISVRDIIANVACQASRYLIKHALIEKDSSRAFQRYMASPYRAYYRLVIHGLYD